MRRAFALTMLICGLLIAVSIAAEPADDGFAPLFNGRDLSGWKVPAGDNGHWKAIDGVIDYDAESEAAGEKHLWTADEFGDFVFRCEWRLKSTPFLYKGRIILPDGSEKLDADGKPILVEFPDADSGILLRGGPQVNLWCWPVGSGELWQIRRNAKLPAEVRAAATPKTHADKNIGEWNAMEITLVGDRVTVVLNGQTVIENAALPGIAARGPIGLQHHGSKRDGKWTSPPSLIQFRNLSVKRL